MVTPVPHSDYFARRAKPTGSPALHSALEVLQPDMLRSIVLLWGHPEMNVWFDRIWNGAAGSQLNSDVISELMLLSQMHHRLVPAPTPQVSLPSQRRVPGGDPWADGFSR